MSLTQSMEVARTSLAVLSARTAVTSRNVANAGNDYASRKIAQTVSSSFASGVRLAPLTRASNEVLFRSVIASNSEVGRHEAIVTSLDQLNETINDPEQDSSPAAMVGKLADALQQFSAAPQDDIRAQFAISTAFDMVNTLNGATDQVQQTRTRADQQIANSVDTLNSLLAQFEEVNNDIVNGTIFKKDVTDLLDTRDVLLSDISREIGIRTVARENNDIAIFTDSGVTLFETRARTVSFEPMLSFNPNDTGNAVFVDNTRVTGDAAVLPISSGRLAGLVEVRDELTVTYQSQLDEVARSLITMFSESDQSAVPALPDATGLFIYSGSPAVPAAGTIIPGLARDIRINPAVDPSQGGDATLLRDGGINGAAYVYNDTGGAAFAGRLLELSDEFYEARSFDPLAFAGNQETLVNFSANSVGWLQKQRQSASTEAEFRSAVYERSLESLVQETGVNLDYEMTVLLELERSYQATSRLIAAIDNMYGALISASG